MASDTANIQPQDNWVIAERSADDRCRRSVIEMRFPYPDVDFPYPRSSEIRIMLCRNLLKFMVVDREQIYETVACNIDLSINISARQIVSAVDVDPSTSSLSNLCELDRNHDQARANSGGNDNAPPHTTTTEACPTVHRFSFFVVRDCSTYILCSQRMSAR